ncbi:MAG: copper amine oxidase N-terminal domain-containing protein, partial [Firmicutes bacterium]|nr:copper amine oxidase N-terminal domain-containing protein [Bacillota bacterium]
MKKLIAFALSLAVFSSNVFAADVVVNGNKLGKEAVIIDSSSYLPLRAVAEALGLDISWDGATKTVYINTQGLSDMSAGVSEDMQAADELNGVWFARSSVTVPYIYTDSGEDDNVGSMAGYYVFGSDGMSGYYRSQETGTDTLFSYKKEGSSLTITFKDGRGTQKAVIERTNNIVTGLNWADGKTDNMFFMYPDGEPEFYTSKKLCELALGYYEEQNKYRPQYAEATVGEDNNINIRLYDIVDDHTSTSDFYTINSTTASGVNVTGEYIDI